MGRTVPIPGSNAQQRDALTQTVDITYTEETNLTLETKGNAVTSECHYYKFAMASSTLEELG